MFRRLIKNANIHFKIETKKKVKKCKDGSFHRIICVLLKQHFALVFMTLCSRKFRLRHWNILRRI